MKDGFRAFHQRLMEPTPSPREKQPTAPALEREAIFPGALMEQTALTTFLGIQELSKQF